MNSLRHSIVGKTGQSWKLGLGLTFLLIGFATMVTGLQRLQQPNGFETCLTGIAIGLSAFAGTCAAVRCRSCGMRWLWAAMKGQEQLQWLNWLAAQRTCPRCGADA